MNKNKLIATVGLAVVVISMMTSNQLSIHASPTTEDDGWTESDYEGSTEEQEEQAQEDWEDAGRPGDDDNDNNDNDDAKGDDGEQIFTCSDGSTVTEDEECPSTGPNPYCDTPEGKAATICHDRYDTDENGVATCNDGTHKDDPKDCKDATQKRCEYKVVQDCVLNDLGQTCKVGTSEDACQDIFYGYDGSKYKPGEKIGENSNNKNGGSGSKSSSSSSSSSSKTTIINPNADPNAAEVSTCKLNGNTDGLQQKFDSIKYRACGLYLNAQISYTDGFVVGCTQVGNTQLVCQALVDSSILNTITQPTQTTTQPTQTTTQPTQAIQPATIGG
jgi:hypothetical protein